MKRDWVSCFIGSSVWRRSLVKGFWFGTVRWIADRFHTKRKQSGIVMLNLSDANNEWNKEALKISREKDSI